MSKYDKTKKYWLQLREDWYDDDAIKWLEEQPNGEKYSGFYMKLMLKSIKTNGILIRQIGKLLIPYDPPTLAELTRTKEVDTVIVAMELLKKIGLVEILEDGAIYINQVQTMIGYTTKGAEKKSLQRETQKTIEWTESGQMSTKDKDITKDKNKDIIINKNKTTDIQTILKGIENDDLRKNIDEFIIMRNRIKKPITAYGVTLILKAIEKLSKDIPGQIQILQQSILNGWQGVFPLKKENNTNQFDTNKYERSVDNDC